MTTIEITYKGVTVKETFTQEMTAAERRDHMESMMILINEQTEDRTKVETKSGREWIYGASRHISHSQTGQLINGRENNNGH